MRRITDHRNPLSLHIAGVHEPSSNKTLDLSLHVCRACGSCLIQPTSWEQEEDRSGWRVRRRCPECEWSCESVHNEVEIDAFDEQLDLGSQELLNELRAMEHANMRASAAAFIAALENDLIGAEDFR
jgi:hypothetical protein